MQILNRYKLTIAGLGAGAIAGYMYYTYIGCTSGSCAITSNPVNSTLYFSMMGALFFNIFEKEKKNNTNEENNN